MSNGNGSLIPTELRWLYREIWIWRGFGLLVVLLFTVIEAVKWRDLTQHNRETKVFETGVQLNQEVIKRTIQKNWDAVQKVQDSVTTVDEHLRQCSGCHSHPDLDGAGWLRRKP